MAKLLTRDDVIRAGACADGVYEWAGRFATDKTAIPVDVALRLCRHSEDARRWVLRAADLDGNGDGDGNGYGYGYGDGNGYGGYDE